MLVLPCLMALPWLAFGGFLGFAVLVVIQLWYGFFGFRGALWCWVSCVVGWLCWWSFSDGEIEMKETEIKYYYFFYNTATEIKKKNIYIYIYIFFLQYLGLVFHDAEHFGAWNAKFSYLALAFPNADALNMLYPFAKSKDSLLFLSLFISSTTAHTSSLHLHVLSLSTPKLDSHHLASPLEIEIHRQTLPVLMRPTFLSSENTQNRLFFLLFPNSNPRRQKFSHASNN